MNFNYNLSLLLRGSLVGIAAIGSLLVGNSQMMAVNHCVRSDAVGAGTGADWENAYNVLPPQLVRGDIYYIADGTYPGYLFDDVEVGVSPIVIRKATLTDHGSDVGWREEYGDGVAEWRVNLDVGSGYVCGWAFLTSHYIIDGAVGGGFGSWEAGHGFKMSQRGAKVIFVMLSDKWGFFGPRPNVNNITLAHTEIEGELIPGHGIGVQGNAYNTTINTIRISNMYLHDIGGAFMDFRANPSDVLIEHCRLLRNSTAPTAHGVGVRFDYVSGPVVFRFNWMSDVIGTGWIGHYTGNPDDGDGMEFYGNMFSSSIATNTGLGVIFSDSNNGEPVVDNWKIYNNTFVNLPTHGTLVSIDTPGSRRIQAYNNLAYNLGGAINLVNVDDRRNNHLVLTNLFADIRAGNFRLTSPSPIGFGLGSPYNFDAIGSTRGAGSGWDVGAFEFVDGLVRPEPPRNLSSRPQ